MALLKFLFDRHAKNSKAPKTDAVSYRSPEPIGPQCRNPNCVTVKELVSSARRFQILPTGQANALILACAYCDHRFKVQIAGNLKTKKYLFFDHSLAATFRQWMKRDELALFDSIKEAEELGYEPSKSGPQRILMNEREIGGALASMSEQILRDCREPGRILILGVRGAGSQLAQRLANEIGRRASRNPEVGEIEIYGSGDELRRLSPEDPDAGQLDLKDREVILADDVIFTGRTVKSALSIIFRSGRPRSVRLAVLVDRGHREVPVKPNYVGKHIPSSESDRVRVKLRELDPEEHDQVVIYTIISPGEEAAKPARKPELAAK
jgi:pyrimidine operon attenuation protein/uracil phosphoribosyltransferase